MIFWFIIVTIILWSFPVGSREADAAVTRYTTSTARGAISTGTCPNTGGSRCTNARALSLSSAGDTVIMEGNTMASPYEYKGANDMLAAGGDGGGLISGKNGASGSPITVRCSVEGGCLINGEFARVPLRLNLNNWWVFEDFNVKNGFGQSGVINVNASSDNIFRKIVAWDAPLDENVNVIGVHANQGVTSSRNFFEDIAVFGSARKMFSGSQGGHNLTCRRCWFRWEGNTWGGGSGTTLVYNSLNAIFENVLVTWSGESMPQTYTVPASAAANPGVPFSNFEVNAPGSMVTVDRIDSTSTPKPANATMRGSIIYTKQTDRLPSTASGGIPGGTIPGVGMYGTSSIALIDIVRVMDPDHTRFNLHLGFGLVRRPQNCVIGVSSCEDPVTNDTADRITSVRGTKIWGTNIGDSFGTNGISGKANETDWTVTGKSQGNCVTGSTQAGCTGGHVTAVQTPWQNTSTNGARLCYQYGTTTPLWPWPMNDRIKAATLQAGAYAGPCTVSCVGGRAARTETDVTADIEALLGTIPSTCRSDTAPSTFPDATGFAPASLSTF